MLEQSFPDQHIQMCANSKSIKWTHLNFENIANENTNYYTSYKKEDITKMFLSSYMNLDYK